ncbi:hypothetical protein C4573_05670 [Candidatus Woesearchaeota archaeon]|nr:MAG: hypothetical protein C4573_05670 [Candidatus Woesearchaeota archaeon]
MKAYITCPISHTKNRLHLLPEIEKIAKDNKLDAFVFQIGGSPKEIFTRDYKQLKSCNLLIAEVSETSHGVGIEIGMSYCLGLKRILLHEKGTLVSKLVQGMPETTVIEYEDLPDLRKKLSTALEVYKN